MSVFRSVATFVMATLCAAGAYQSAALGQAARPARQNTAQLIGVESELDTLNALARTTPSDSEARWKLLWLHQRISERVTATSLQVDAAIAQIDNEVARANEVRGYLADRRDRTVSRANLLSAIFGGAIGATSSGLQLSSSLGKPAAAVGIGAGAASTGLALVGIHAQAGKSSQFDFQSNMLAEIFERPTLPDSQYPETVWIFLNEPSADAQEGRTRRQELVATWVRVKRIDSLASAEKIDRLTSQPSESLKLSIDDFEDRAAMLQDVRARISFLKRDLGKLLASLPELPDGVRNAP